MTFIWLEKYLIIIRSRAENQKELASSKLQLTGILIQLEFDKPTYVIEIKRNTLVVVPLLLCLHKHLKSSLITFVFPFSRNIC